MADSRRHRYAAASGRIAWRDDHISTKICPAFPARSGRVLHVRHRLRRRSVSSRLESNIRAKDTYRSDIDGLRAIAVLLVLVFHFNLVPGGKAGFIGVDVFFVISGFLITTILKRQLDRGTFSIGRFYLGRVRRLAPSLLVTLVGVSIAGAVLLFPDDFVELSRQVLYSQFYVANLYYWRNVNYFGLGGDDVFLLHTWSLAVEEQFYLLYPLVLLGVHRFARRYFWHAIAAMLLLSFGLNVAFVARKPEATFYLLPTRAWELLAGALIPLLAVKWARSQAADEALGALGLALIVAGVVTHRPDIHFPGFFALLPVGGAACLLLSGGGSTRVSGWLGLRPIAWVGKISYPLYLVHWPINVFAHRLLSERYTLDWRFAMFGLSVALAAAIYHALENPIRHRQWLRVDTRLLRSYGAGLAATVLLSVLAANSGGFPQRFPAEVNRLAAFVNDKSPPLTECEYTGAARPEIGSGFCTIGVVGKAPSWVVYGDSHAWAAHDAFDGWLRQKGEAGLFIFRHGCPPVTGLHLFGDKGECFAFNASMLGFFDAHRDIDNVLLVSTWRQASEGLLSTAPDAKLSTAESLALFDAKFGQTLAELHRLNKRVYIWEPVPGARGNVPLALARAALEHRPADVAVSRERYLAENAFFFSALEKNRRLVAASFSPSDALCASGTCAVTADGNPAYSDNSHVTRSSASFWIKMMQGDELRAKTQLPSLQP